MRGSRGLAAFGLFIGLLSPSVDAQEFRATIQGRVTDTQDAAVPGATVTVKNEGTGESLFVTTNARGHCTVPYLKPGRYAVTVELNRDNASFGTFVKASGAQSNLPRHLQLGVRLMF